jgi:hypothetical protein
MTRDETAGYIASHLAHAGRDDTLFSADAITLIHDNSRGLPRAVNNLAIQSLIATYIAGNGIVDQPPPAPQSPNPPRHPDHHPRHPEHHHTPPDHHRRGFPHPKHPQDQRREHPQD